MIEITNLKKTFNGKIAVDIPSLQIAEGSLVGIVGNNGAGKTTLFRLILDLLKADTGCVRIDGKDVAKDEHWKQTTGSFLDSHFLIEFLTAEEYLYFVGQVYGLSKDETALRVAAFARFLHGEILGERKYIRNLSAGNKQKLGILAAMMVHPRLLILDEPFNYLDPSSQLEMRDLLLRMNKEEKTSILISSHNLAYTIDISSRLILLEQGLILKDISDREQATEELGNYFLKESEA
ncbi:MAG: ABC transporter ATP-binding protein [Tannerella sp.]|jgi:ABC-2 type transport system ATP-binding protein|nr:ABC transporter ATP-binding protein [Tannerella sp.]